MKSTNNSISIKQYLLSFFFIYATWIPVFAQSYTDSIFVDINTEWPDKENGSYYYPYSSIQKAINSSIPGKTIRIAPGTYREHLNIFNNEINIIGMDPDSTLKKTLIVIEGYSSSPVITLHNTNAACHIQGIHITHEPHKSHGAIFCQSSHLKLINCLITGHHIKTEQNPLILGINSRVDMINCTVADNTVVPTNSIFHLNKTPLRISNSIIWNNTGIPLMTEGTVQPDISYTNIEGAYPGKGNLNQDPLFIRPGTWQDPNTITLSATDVAMEPIWIPGDYHLQSLTAHWSDEQMIWQGDYLMSPCIDSGDPNSHLGSETVPTGNRVNMGAYGGIATASKSYNTEEIVQFGSQALKETVEETLGIFDPTPADMLSLVVLDAGYLSFACATLKGLEYAINLEVLIINNSRINNLNPLSELTKLRYLDVSDNKVLSDIYGLAHLTSLEFLDFHYNQVNDITAVSTLPNLRELIVRRNGLYDLHGMEKNTKLERLDVSINNLTSIDVLTEHNNLIELMLDENPWEQPQFDIDMETISANNPDIQFSDEKLRLTDPFSTSE